MDEVFEAWDAATDTWSEWSHGRLYPADRFKTIYHRPTRRETLSLPQGVSLPASKVFRHVTTAEVFMASETEHYDAADGQVYSNLYAVHRASLKSTVLRPTVSGTGDNLGPVSLIDQGVTYADVELRATDKDPADYALQLGNYEGNYFITLSPAASVLEGDFLDSGSQSYRIDHLYLDGGLLLARGIRMAPALETLTYELRTAAGGGYNTATGSVTRPTVEDREFSGFVSLSSVAVSPGSVSRTAGLEILVGVDHIGFFPVVEDRIRRGSDTFSIISVEVDGSKKLWALQCVKV